MHLSNSEPDHSPILPNTNFDKDRHPRPFKFMLVWIRGASLKVVTVKVRDYNIHDFCAF